ncbi:MAG: hypothetical protein ACK4GO_06165 [Gemmobacter sp.]
MKINSHAVERYVWMLTNGIAASRSDPMEELTGYDYEIDLMIAAAREAGEEELLRRSVDSLLSDPEGRIGMFSGQVHGFRDDEMVDLLTHAYERIWPDLPRSLPGEAPAMEFVPMTDAEWAARQGKA